MSLMYVSHLHGLFAPSPLTDGDSLLSWLLGCLQPTDILIHQSSKYMSPIKSRFKEGSNTTTGPAAIAVVGMACHYPGARSPRELWENVLTQRQQFRRFREERMPSQDYHSPNPHAEDRTYGMQGAFLDGFIFDCLAHRVLRSTYDSTDLSHWLALEVATAALADAGAVKGQGLPLERTGVIVGNTLTGEFTRANSLRLRWPFIERVLRESAAEQGKATSEVEPLIKAAEERFRSFFPATNEDTLAGVSFVVCM